jgi:YgiT-type zinc finger domain-containing protein
VLSFVIPAKAGIHDKPRQVCYVLICHIIQKIGCSIALNGLLPWVPAFAGMTKKWASKMDVTKRLEAALVARLRQPEHTMKCAICKHGTTAPGATTVTLERAGTVVVIKDVPADICEDCGEYYLDAATATRVAAMGEEAVQHKAEVEVRKYAA